MSISNDKILSQLRGSERDKRLWLHYKTLSLKFNPDMEEKKLSPKMITSRRIARLWEEISQSYLAKQYLSTIILTGAFLEGVTAEIRKLFIEALDRTARCRQIDDYTREIIPFFKWKDFEELAKSKNDVLCEIGTEREYKFIERLVEFNLMTSKAKGAWKQAKTRRDDHVHNNLVHIVERFQRRSLLSEDRIAE